MTPNRAHVPEEQLAALVEGGLAGDEARAVKEHLARCRICLAAYADAVRLRDAWRLGEMGGTVSAAPHAPRRAFAGARGLAVAAGLSLLVATAAWLAVSGSRTADPGRGEILALVARVSHHGPILPGAAGAAWNPLPVTRSGGHDTAGTLDLRGLLKELHDRPGRAPSAALEIAGYLALDDLAMAGIRLQRELETGGGDPDLFVVAGILAYRQSRLEQARTHLQRALDLRPGDPAARFNLALVQSETGGIAPARMAFEALAARDDLPLVSHRARQELARLRDLQPGD